MNKSSVVFCINDKTSTGERRAHKFIDCVYEGFVFFINYIYI